MLKALLNFLKLKPRVTEQKDLPISQPTIEPVVEQTISVETPIQENTQTKPTPSKPTAKKPNSKSTPVPKKATSPGTRKKTK